MLSALRAIYSFLVSTDKNGKPHDYGMIWENDAVPHNNFQILYDKTIQSLNESLNGNGNDIKSSSSSGDAATLNLSKLTENVIMLSYYNSGFDGIKKVSDMFSTIGKLTYSTLGYLISRKYAQSLIDTFCISTPPPNDKNNLDKLKFRPFADIPADKCLSTDNNPPNNYTKRITSEIITIKSGGVFVNIPLLVDESLDTSIQNQISNQWHLNYYAQFDHNNYADADIDAKNDELLQLWKIKGKK